MRARVLLMLALAFAVGASVMYGVLAYTYNDYVLITKADAVRLLLGCTKAKNSI